MTAQALTVKQFAERYSLNPSTVSAQVTRQADALPKFLRIGKQIRFPVLEIEKWELSQLNADASQNL